MGTVTRKSLVRDHFDNIAGEYDYWKQKNSYYYDTIIDFVSSIVPRGNSVLEIGCATGSILASLKPSRGVGVDLSSEMIKIASEKHPEYSFYSLPVEKLELDEKFDFVLMIDVVDHVYDVMDVFKQVHKFCKPTTRIILTTINPWWDPILSVMEKLGAKMPEGPHNFIEKGNLKRMAEVEDLSVSYSGYQLLFPKKLPLLSYLANSIGVRTWLINKFSSVQYMIMQTLPKNTVNLELGCSVIIPCHNEEDNIQEAIKRVPHMGKGTEIVVVDDGSKDSTLQKVKEMMEFYPNLVLISYPKNEGKGAAVKKGFEAATKEVVMVLDADLSVSPEELPRFFEPLNKGICQFVNGTRMVYPMEHQAMRILNLLGNKIFGFILSFIIQQNLTDTLCGTKALYRKDIDRIKWGKDKWGDFDLLFGASRIGSKIIEIPVHYMSRKSGESKMRSFKHGLHLLRACCLGFVELVSIRSVSKFK